MIHTSKAFCIFFKLLKRGKVRIKIVEMKYVFFWVKLNDPPFILAQFMNGIVDLAKL